MNTVLGLRHLFLGILVTGCVTRVGNPPKPTPAAVTVPSFAELVPETPGTLDPGDGGFSGSADFLKSLGTASPNHREVLAGLNAIGAYLGELEVEVDEARTEAVEG